MKGRPLLSRTLLPVSVAACAVFVLSSCSQPSSTSTASSGDPAVASDALPPILKEDGTPDYLAMAERAKRPDETFDLTKLDKKYFMLPHSAQDYADLAKLPDWTGMWAPNEAIQNAETENSPTPWNEKALGHIRRNIALHRSGHPDNQNYEHCMPEGMPTWMMIYHNLVEILFTPGRVTMLGESEGNELRRIFTDGRGHPAEPIASFFGHEIGHWEGDTLVVDTIGVFPEVPLSVEEAMGVPNSGDMHIVEHIHLAGADELHDELAIDAPHILTRVWNTTRILSRKRSRPYEIMEGVCLRGHFIADTSPDGFPVFTYLPFEEGVPLAPPTAQ